MEKQNLKVIIKMEKEMEKEKITVNIKITTELTDTLILKENI